MLHPIPSCFSSLYFNYWAFETILHLVPCVKFTFVAVCVITPFASCIGQSWSEERADFSVQECWSRSQVNFVIDIGQIMLWTDQPCSEYHTFLVKNRVCQVMQHCTKESEASHWPMGAHLSKVLGSQDLVAAIWSGHFGFSGLSTNCSIKWLSADKFHVLLTSCKIRISSEG